MRRAAPASQATDRLPFLEGLRGLAALYVVLGHICSMADPSRLAGRVSKAPDWLQQVSSFFAYGHLAVAAFIVLSGYCLQLSLFTNGDGRIKDLKRFAVRRAKRILPAYYGSLGLSLLIVWLVTSKQAGTMPFDLYLPLTQQNVLAHVFLVHNLSLDWMYKINGVLWSIAIEVQLYLLFPLLVLALTKLKRRWFILGTALAAGAALAMLPNAPKMYPWYLALFAVGMASAHFAYRPHLKVGPQPFAALSVALLALVACGYAMQHGQPLYVGDALVGVAIASILHAGAVAPQRLSIRALSWKPLVTLGGFSYSLYLMHHPVQQVLYAVRPTGVEGEAGLFMYLLVCLPVIVLACWAFSLAFERPFLSYRPAPKVEPDRPFTPVSLPLRVYKQPEPIIVKAVIETKVPERVAQGLSSAG